MLLYLLALATILILIYYYVHVYKAAQYFIERDIAYVPPWKSMKNLLSSIFGEFNVFEMVKNIYKDFPNERFVGVWRFGVPTLYIRDPALIKQLTIKDFDYFTDRRGFSTSSDDIFSKNLFSMKGDKWRNMRATLSPAFTSSKMRNMYVFMDECARNFAETFADRNEDIIHVEMKDIVTKYTSDVIASASFGIKCDSLGNPENEFYRMGRALTERSKTQRIKIILIALYPKIAQYFGLSFFPEDVSTFFKRVISDTVKTREENHIIRPDMIHLLMEARKGRLRHETTKDSDAGFATVEESTIGKSENGKLTEITDDDISGQALIFFFAGFETTSSTMSFMALELCKNPDVQEKLHKEIDEVLANSEGGNVTYEEILKLKYLDQVLSETLRKWTPAFQSDRVCVRDYVIEPVKPGEKPYVLKKGDTIIIPAVGVHYDPEHYTNPDTFDPDRFSDENKKNIAPGTYIPFGIGPRNCIGSRFALLEIKVFFFHLLTKFELVFAEKMLLPLQIVTVGISIKPKGGFQLALKRRKGVY